MTNLRTPTDPSRYTAQQGKDNAKRDKKNSELVRGILIAIAIPLVAGAAYLVYSGKDLNFTSTASVEQPPATTEGDRNPATSATLPVVQVDATPVVKTTVSLNDVASTALPLNPTTESGSKQLSIVLDENGVMTSPFSVELDEEGQEVARLEFKDYIAFLPPLPLGPYEKVRSLKDARPSEEFLKMLSAANGKTVYKYDADEIRRFALLRGQAPEVRTMLEIYDVVARSQLGKQPIAVDSFRSSTASPLQHRAADTDLRWLEPTLVLSQAVGANSYDARLKEAVLEWVKTYKPSGRIEEDIRMSKVAMAFEVVQSQMTREEVEKCMAFFLNLADIQFIQMKAHKLYDPAHAFHVDFMATLGAATKDPRILHYTAIQYGYHIERSPIFKLNAFDREHFQIMAALLNTTFIFDRLGLKFFQNQVGTHSLAHGISILLNSSSTEGRDDYVRALAAAAYFDPTVYPTLSAVSPDRTNRFATTHGTTLAALRKPTTSLKPSNIRIPSSLPKKRGR